jgi:hypothetical protein
LAFGYMSVRVRGIIRITLSASGKVPPDSIVVPSHPNQGSYMYTYTSTYIHIMFRYLFGLRKDPPREPHRLLQICRGALRVVDQLVRNGAALVQLHIIRIRIIRMGVRIIRNGIRIIRMGVRIIRNGIRIIRMGIRVSLCAMARCLYS